MEQPIYLLLAFPVFALFIGVELLVGLSKKKKWYRLNDTVTNLNIGIGSVVFNLFIKLFLFVIYLTTFKYLAIYPLPNAWWTFILCLFAYDFFYYWAHRLSHEINFLWGAHVVHHSSEEYNLSVALRQSWVNNLLAFAVFFPMPILGFPPEIFFTVGVIHTLYQFWIHTRAIKRLPKFIEWFWNTPSHHRVHHGVNPKYIDKNHAGMFIIWDKLFGTFQMEEEAPTYGITTQLKSWNPIWANLHYYTDMFREAKKMKRWKDRLFLIIARPGWRPKELGGYQAPPPTVPEDQINKYDKRGTPVLHAYIMIQFILTLGGLMAYMYYFETLSLPFQLVFFAIILLSTMICGGLFEQKKWVISLEYLKLGVLLVSLNIFYFQYYLDWFWVVLIATSIGFHSLNSLFTLSWIVSKKLRPKEVDEGLQWVANRLD